MRYRVFVVRPGTKTQEARTRAEAVALAEHLSRYGDEVEAYDTRSNWQHRIPKRL